MSRASADGVGRQEAARDRPLGVKLLADGLERLGRQHPPALPGTGRQERLEADLGGRPRPARRRPGAAGPALPSSALDRRGPRTVVTAALAGDEPGVARRQRAREALDPLPGHRLQARLGDRPEGDPAGLDRAVGVGQGRPDQVADLGRPGHPCKLLRQRRAVPLGPGLRREPLAEPPRHHPPPLGMMPGDPRGGLAVRGLGRPQLDEDLIGFQLTRVHLVERDHRRGGRRDCRIQPGTRCRTGLSISIQRVDQGMSEHGIRLVQRRRCSNFQRTARGDPVHGSRPPSVRSGPGPRPRPGGRLASQSRGDGVAP